MWLGRWVLVCAVAACASHSPSNLDATTGDANGDTTPCTPFDTVISSSSASEATNAVWTGTEYLALVSSNDVFAPPHPSDNVLQVIGGDGQLGAVFATIPAAEGSLFWPQALAWTGTELGALVSNMETLVLYRYDATGAQLGTTTVTTTGSQAALVWAGDRFATTWIDEGNNLWFDEITSDGVANPAVKITSTQGGATEVNALAASPTTYAFAASNLGGPIQIFLIDRTTMTVAQQRIGQSSVSAIIAVGDQFIAEVDDDPPAFANIDAKGFPESVRAIPLQDERTAMVATSRGYSVFGAFQPGMTTTNLAEADLDATGVALAPSTPIDQIVLPTGFTAVPTGTRAAALYVSYGLNTGPYARRLIQRCAP